MPTMRSHAKAQFKPTGAVCNLDCTFKKCHGDTRETAGPARPAVPGATAAYEETTS